MYCKLRRLDLLRNGQLSDCELHISYVDNCKKRYCRQFRCHKQMLASASEEFARMIDNPNFEKNKRIIVVDDASPDAYEALLLYIYTYEIYSDITVEMCAELIHLATKYKMPDFVDSYVGKLASQSWPIGTVLKIFQLANDYNRPAILKLVEEKIIPIATQVLNDNSFLRLSVQQLKALMIILKSQKTIPEKQLLLALKKYQKCNNLYYGNMACFQQFVAVTSIFGEMLFELDGTLAVNDKEDPIKKRVETASSLTAIHTASATISLDVLDDEKQPDSKPKPEKDAESNLELEDETQSEPEEEDKRDPEEDKRDPEEEAKSEPEEETKAEPQEAKSEPEEEVKPEPEEDIEATADTRKSR